MELVSETASFMRCRRRQQLIQQNSKTPKSTHNDNRICDWWAIKIRWTANGKNKCVEWQSSKVQFRQRFDFANDTIERLCHSNSLPAKSTKFQRNDYFQFKRWISHWMISLPKIAVIAASFELRLFHKNKRSLRLSATLCSNSNWKLNETFLQWDALVECRCWIGLFLNATVKVLLSIEVSSSLDVSKCSFEWANGNFEWMKFLRNSEEYKVSHKRNSSVDKVLEPELSANAIREENRQEPPAKS